MGGQHPAQPLTLIFVLVPLIVGPCSVVFISLLIVFPVPKRMCFLAEIDERSNHSKRNEGWRKGTRQVGWRQG